MHPKNTLEVVWRCEKCKEPKVGPNARVRATDCCRQRWPIGKVPKPVIPIKVNGLQCPICKKVVNSTEDYARRTIEKCCQEYLCQDCGEQPAKYDHPMRCGACIAKREREVWENLPIADMTGCKAMVVASDRYYHDLDEYLECCVDDDVSPKSGCPVWATFRLAATPNIVETIGDGINFEDWEPDRALQEFEGALEKLIADNEIGCYEPDDSRPALPSPEEWAAHVAKCAAEEATWERTFERQQADRATAGHSTCDCGAIETCPCIARWVLSPEGGWTCQGCAKKPAPEAEAANA